MNYQYKWLVLAGISLLAFTAFLDFTIVNTALPAIEHGLSATINQLQWVMNIYTLVVSVLMILAGKLGDIYGHKKLFLIGAAVFFIASLLAGSSSTPELLIFSRLLQGLGAAIIFPMATSLLIPAFPEAERHKALGIYGSIGGLGLAVGPVLGGLLVHILSWRWVFFINVPIIAIALGLCLAWLPKVSREQINIKIDWIGALLFIISVGSLILGINQSQTLGWDNFIIFSYFLVTLISGLALITLQLKKQQPLLELRFFNNLVFYAGAAACGIAGFISIIALFFNPFYLQIIKQQTALTAGLVLFAIPLVVIILSPFIGKLSKKFGVVNVVIWGVISAIVASILQIYFTTNSSLFFIIITYVFLGITWTLGNTISSIATHESAPQAKFGAAIGTVYTLFNLMGAIGLAIATVIFQTTLKAKLLPAIMDANLKLSDQSKNMLAAAIKNPDSFQQAITKLPIDHANIEHLFSQAFLLSIHNVFLFTAVISGLVLGSLVFWKRKAKTSKNNAGVDSIASTYYHSTKITEIGHTNGNLKY